MNFRDAGNWGWRKGIEEENEERGEREVLYWECRVQVKLPYFTALSKYFDCFYYQELKQASGGKKKKNEEVWIPSLESNPTTRHHLGLRTVKANFFDVLGEPQGKTASNPARAWNARGLEWKCVFLQGRRGWREGLSSLNNEIFGLERTGTLRVEVHISGIAYSEGI